MATATTIEINSFIKGLELSRGHEANLTSIKLACINNSWDDESEARLLAEYQLEVCRHSEGHYLPPDMSMDLIGYFDNFGGGEDWYYLGRDPFDGEKMYELMNPGSVEEKARKLFYAMWEAEFKSAAA